MEFYSCQNVRNIKEWKNIATCNSIQDIAMIRFSRAKGDHENSVKMINSEMKQRIQGVQPNTSVSNNNLKALKLRLS